MNNLFAREPVFTLNKTLYAYQFIYRDQPKGAFPMDLGTLSINGEAQSGLSLDELMQVHTTIVNLQLEDVAAFCECFTPENVVVEITSLMELPNNDIVDNIQALKKCGFELMLSQQQAKWPELLSLANYVKCELTQTTPDEIRQLKSSLRDKPIKLIASQVHTQFQFEQCQSLAVDLVQGFFFLESTQASQKPVPTNKVAYMQLLTEIAKPKLDIDSLQTVFEQDPTLSFLLMKFINNPLVNKSYKVNSIRHALNYLGELMVRRFVAIVSLAGMNANKPNELLNLSLVRAKYCELVDADLTDSSDAMSAFLVGLFSLLDVILDKPLIELLTSLDLDEKIEQALIHRKGLYWDILSSSGAIESGDWRTLILVGQKLQLSQQFLFEKHRQSVRWQNDITEAVSPNFPVAQAAGQH